jgi:outer membrane protein OmpA-like peptidoglycan-associated protein
LNFISENQLSGTIDLKDAKLGTYNLKVINPGGRFGELSAVFTVQEKPSAMAKPTITALSSEGFNIGSILITFKGVGFVPGTSVKLINASGKIITGEIVKSRSNEITGFFNLKNQSDGSYDILVTYPDGHLEKIPQGFKVKEFSEANAKTLMKVYFDVAKSNISTDQVKIIKERLTGILKNPKVKIILGGYTDMRGSASYNLKLSMERAEALKTILVDGGVNLEQIDIYAFGKEKAQQGQDENVWRNDRRVDIVVYQEN